MLNCLNARLSLAETQHDYEASVRTLMPQFITPPDNNEAMKQAGLGVKLGPRHAIVLQPLLPLPLQQFYLFLFCKSYVHTVFFSLLLSLS